MLNLQVVRVNLRDRTVYLPPRSTKNKKPRAIPISDAELPLLRRCIEGKQPEEHVLTRKNDLPIRDFRERWEQIVAAAKAGHWEIGLDGSKTWYPAIVHDLRRTAITNMLAGGMPKEMVQSIVGHLSDEMTERYCQPRADMLRKMQQLALAARSVLTQGKDVAQNVQQIPEQTTTLAATL